MLRLAPPDFDRFLQRPEFQATWGGGEANVAVALGNFGMPVRYVTVLPPDNPIADAFIGELRRFGVDPSFIVRRPGRLGIYFVERGANQRPSKVVYDRDHTAIARAKPGDIDWDRAFDGAGWFHITGITPALSGTAAELAADAVELHTGQYALAKPGAEQGKQLVALARAGALVRRLGMTLHAGHGLTYRNVRPGVEIGRAHV